jgi:hypothetical protein
MRTKILFLAFFTFLIFNCSAQAPNPNKGPLDGRKFTAEIFETGKKKPLDPDDLSFVAGKFKSVVFADWGFTKPMKYLINEVDTTTTPGVKIYSWAVDQMNDIDEKLAWSGQINGEDIEGTIELINKKGVTKKSFTFTGKMKKKPGQK